MTGLYITPSRSECGACGKNADPGEDAHDMARMKGEGCGARFTFVSSHYFGYPSLYDSIQAMRPDLPFREPGPDWEGG